MIVTILLIVAAVGFGFAAFFPLPTRADAWRSIVAAGLGALAAGLAFWHGGH